MTDIDAVRDDQLDAIRGLGEPTRRTLYEFVAHAGDWVSRDQAAEAVGLGRAITAHHLDRLAEDGLLEVDYQRLSGRSGPGAGRPAKVYRRARREFGVALPPRDYELAGRLLADAIAAASGTGTDVRMALDNAARSEGSRLGKVMQERAGRRSSDKRSRGALLEVLTDHGFEPEQNDDGTIVLRNCPFHRLAQTHRDLICGMNHCLIDAALGELGTDTLDARLEPDPDTCCVRLHRRRPTSGEVRP